MYVSGINVTFDMLSNAQPYFSHVFRVTEIAATQICLDVAPPNYVVRLGIIIFQHKNRDPSRK